MPDDADDGGSGGTADVAPAQLLLQARRARGGDARRPRLVRRRRRPLPIAEALKTNASEKMEAVVALANLAENPATHDDAFGGDDGARPSHCSCDCSGGELRIATRGSGRSHASRSTRAARWRARARRSTTRSSSSSSRKQGRRAAARPTTTRWFTPRVRLAPVVAAAQPPQDRRRRRPSAHVLVGAPRRHGRAGRGGDGDRQRDLRTLGSAAFCRRDGALHLLLYLCASEVHAGPPPVRSPTSRRRSTTSRRFARRARRSSCTRCTTRDPQTSSGRRSAPSQTSRRVASSSASAATAAPRRRSSTRARWATSASTPTPPTSERSAKSRARSPTLRRRRRTTTS